jgi:hypothetical protein
MERQRLIKLHCNIAAFRGQTKAERRQIREDVMLRYYKEYWSAEQGELESRKLVIEQLSSDSRVFAAMQDRIFPVDLYSAERIMVMVVPEHNTMSGGIYSFFSIAEKMRRLKRDHGYEILTVTRPSLDRLTYVRNTNFRNAENVYRFEQILLCRSVKEIYLQIPEYEAATFLNKLSLDELQYLLSRERVYVNILNQNIKLMPERELFAGLRRIADGLSQSVAHHAYFTQAMADKYDLPTLLLPPYTDLSAYPPAVFEEKEKLIIYSPDEAPHKQKCLETISRKLPDFKLLEIRDITFDRYMDYATRCMFSISFGEGFDGYLAQPIYQGGIGFTVYNNDFFPSPHFRKYENIFDDENEMVNRICGRIVFLSTNRDAYVKLNGNLREEYDKLYSYEKYIGQLKKLSTRHFELFPNPQQLIALPPAVTISGGSSSASEFASRNDRPSQLRPPAGGSVPAPWLAAIAQARRIVGRLRHLGAAPEEGATRASH